MYSRNYSKFSSNDFVGDISIQTWNYDLDNPSDLFNHVDRHVPIKKLRSKEI